MRPLYAKRIRIWKLAQQHAQQDQHQSMVFVIDRSFVQKKEISCEINLLV